MTIPRSQEVFLQDLEFDGDIKNTASGDISRIDSLGNLRQAVIHRLLTVPGTLPLRPEYGVGLKLYQGRLNRLPAQEELMRSIQEQFENDERIDTISSLQVGELSGNPGQVTVRVIVRAVGGQETSVEVEV